jgi:colanic acid biosynthesis glycosyl transferase WcaI
MKILLITQYFWPENFKINDLANHIADKGHNVVVLTGIPNYPRGKYYNGYSIFKNNQEIINNIKIYRSFVIPRKSGNLFFLILNYLSFAIFSTIKVIFLKEKFDIIFVYEPSPFTVAIPAIFKKRIRKIPFIFWVTDLWPESVTATINLSPKFKPLIQKLLNPLVKLIYKESDKILVTSKAFIPSIIDKYGDSKKISYFPYWAERIFKPIKIEKYLFNEIPKDSFKVMFAGNIGEAQDFPSIIETAKNLKDHSNIQWIILGEGRRIPWVKEKIAEFGLENCFHLLGSFPLEKMPEYYANADAMLLSLKDEYIFSITIPAKLQSYLACGKPILGMIRGETADIINKSNVGFTCLPGDSQGLAENIKKMSNLPHKHIKQLSQNSLECYYNNFDREVLFKKAEKILTGMVNKKKFQYK